MTTDRPEVTIIGDAFVDLIVTVPDIVIGGTFHRKIILRTGGVANVAVMIAKLGEKARFIGKIGDDPFGRYFTESLLSDGVEVHSLTDKKENTGLCISLAYPDGERVLIADRKANDFLSETDLEEYIDEIADSKYVYLSGYSLLNPDTSRCILYIMERCYNHCSVVFNPGAPNLISDEFMPVIKKYVDILILNWDEAIRITGESNEEKVISNLVALAGLSVVTLGKKGCLIVSRDINTHVSVFREVSVKDTTGAGDAFSAGFLVGKLRGLNLIDCARFANDTAQSLLVQRTKELE